MYFECAECGQMDSVVGCEGSSLVQHCPVCESRTRWTAAFEGEGVSF